MADFLNDLPSYNKENFKNFQPNYNRLQIKPQSSFHCNNEYTDSQIIVNQKYNIVVKYLENSVFNEKQPVFNCNKKREISHDNEQGLNTDLGNETKSFKKLRTTSDMQDTRTNSNTNQSSNADETYFIEIDQVDDENQIDNI